MTTLTRAERNNNPGNINYMRRGFDGQVGLEAPPPGGTARFGRYSSMYYGARAAAEQMVIDCFKHGLTTPDEMISDETFGWAPKSDGNAPGSYRGRVCDRVNGIYGVKAGDPGALAGNTDLRVAIKDAQFLQALSGGFFVVENGHFPVGLTSDDHLHACQSALAAQGFAP